MTLTITLTTRSAVALVSHRVAGREVDLAVDTDEYGLPCWNGSRLHGLLADTWSQCGHHFTEFDQVAGRLFPQAGGLGPAKTISLPRRLLLAAEIRDWLLFAMNREASPMPLHHAQELLLEVRRSTARSRKRRGAPEDHTLRAIPLLRRGLTFTGQVDCPTDDEGALAGLLSLLCATTRNAALARHRGHGSVHLAVERDGDTVVFPTSAGS